MRYLVTGHTGFKGAWLTLWLAELGHEVVGVALDPRSGGVFEAARVSELLVHDHRIDIRDANALQQCVSQAEPDVVLHLAAQPLVRESYRDPQATMTTNVNGTMHLLAALQAVPSVKAAVIVTTDKVYRNVNQIWGYRESDPLGGEDPYSASKAMADLLTQSWVHSFPGPPTAIARAGNVIGGGDVSPERLLPDLMRSYQAGESPVLRYPAAVRPWQHVLDCLHGYLVLADELLAGGGQGEWNFGPGTDSFVPVGDVAALVARHYGADASFGLAGDQPPEAGLLALDSRKAELELRWKNQLPFEEAVRWTVEWEQAIVRGRSARSLCREQITAFNEKSGYQRRAERLRS